VKRILHFEAMTTTATTLDPPTSAQFLSDLGFLLTPDGAGTEWPAYLLVALRDQPTLSHFDPERVEYWLEDDGGRSHLDAFSRGTSLPVDHPFSWGLIRIVDRLEVTNEYVSFGGRLSAARIDGFTVAVYASPAPMLRGCGHSQTEDPFCPSVEAFFARLRAVAGDSRDLERRILRLSPQGRYAAYLADACETYRRSQLLQLSHPHTWQSLTRQERRLRAERPSAWAEGLGLLPILRTASVRIGADKEAVDARA
jgi:hypothetical protein